MEKLFSKKAKLLWGLVLLLAWGLVFCLLFRLNGDLTVEAILRYQPENPFLAVLIMLGLFLLKSVDFILYSPVLYAASGVMFPLPFAVLLNTAGMAIMVSVPYLIGRSLGPPIVSRLREKYPKLQVMERLPVKNGMTFSFLLRLLGLPLIPVSLYLGAKECSYREYLSGSVPGLFPVTLCSTVLGSAADDPGSPAFWIALSVHVLCCLSSLLGYGLIRKKQRKQTGKSASHTIFR